MRENKKEKLVAIIFTFVGLFFFILGIILCIGIFDNEGKIETKGTISLITKSRGSDGDTNYEVYVQYEVNGKVYESLLNNYSSSYHEGQDLDIYYRENDPTKIGTKGGDYFMLIFPIMGFISLSVGVIIFIIKASKKKKIANLKSNGTLIYAIIKECTLNIHYTVNGCNPYLIISEWINPETNEIYLFKSDNLWSDPSYIISQKGLTTIPVYIDPSNPKVYFVDTDSLEN